MKWIKCSDRLPEEGDLVYAINGKTGIITPAVYHNCCELRFIFDVQEIDLGDWEDCEETHIPSVRYWIDREDILKD
jgi:hypothetical protein